MKNLFGKSGLHLIILSVLIINFCKKEEVPVLTTSVVINVNNTSATSGGTITSEGTGTVSSRGVCWSTNLDPTIGNYKTADGAGAGTFTSNMSGLNGSTTYFVRAYATNSVGTGYGTTMSFTTSQIITSNQDLPFVGICSDAFIVNGEKFRFVGANSINFGFYNDFGLSIEKAIRTAKENNISVIRIILWLGVRPWGYGTLEEYDKVLDIAARYKVYVVVTLTDCCPGSWAGPTRETYLNAVPHCDCDRTNYTFMNYIGSILTRRNSVNGKIYRNDTTILAWDIANEIRIDYFDPSSIQNWLSGIVNNIKQLDPNHLVTIGMVGWQGDGFFDAYGPYYEMLNVTGLDFFSFHLYAPVQNNEGQIQYDENFTDVIKFRTKTFLSMGKPVVMEEFGFAGYDERKDPTKISLYCEVYKKMMDAAFSSGAIGSMFWGWGVPESKNIPTCMWWATEDHDITDTEFCNLIKNYTIPNISFGKNLYNFTNIRGY
jgi:hypothetical protein